MLRESDQRLPEWGFKQGEVVCQKSADRKSGNNIWNIEDHKNSRLSPSGLKIPKSSFFRDFIDINVGMWNSNNALIPNPDKEMSQLESKPYHWPFLTRGLRICGWSNGQIKYYLLGNPLIWWGSTAALFSLSFIWLALTVRRLRGNIDMNPRNYG